MTVKKSAVTRFSLQYQQLEESEIWDPMSLQRVIPRESPRRVLYGEVEETKGRQVEREKIFF